MSNYRSEIERLENERKTAKIMIVAGLFLFLPLCLYGIYKNSKLKKQIEELERTGGSSSYTPQFNSGNDTTFRGSQGPMSEERKTIPPTGSRRFGDHRGEGGQPRRFGEHGTSGTTHQTSSNGGNANNFTNSADKFKNR